MVGQYVHGFEVKKCFYPLYPVSDESIYDYVRYWTLTKYFYYFEPLRSEDNSVLWTMYYIRSLLIS